MSEFPGRLLGIDHGTQVIGLATCDRIGLIATPLRVWQRKSRREDFEFIQQVIHDENIVGVVIGLPPRPYDFVGTSQSDIVKRWARRLTRFIDVPTYFWDEGLSTMDAEDLLNKAGKSRPDRVDAQAAAVILQTMLDYLREGQPFPPQIEI